jgi:hypothetical protein
MTTEREDELKAKKIENATSVIGAHFEDFFCDLQGSFVIFLIMEFLGRMGKDKVRIGDE